MQDDPKPYKVSLRKGIEDSEKKRGDSNADNAADNAGIRSIANPKQIDNHV